MTTPTRMWLALASALLVNCTFAAEDEQSRAGNRPAARDLASVAASAVPSSRPEAIQVMTATYGASCRAFAGNQTAQVASECDGKANCRYVADNRFGDPAFGCPKDFLVQWRCGDDAEMKTVRHSAVVGEGYEIGLSCGTGTQASGPSFACKADASGMEGLICGDSGLADLDRKLADIYRETLTLAKGAQRKALIHEQRTWIALRNRSCPIDLHDPNSESVVECVEPLYEQRIGALQDERKKLPLTGRGRY